MVFSTCPAIDEVEGIASACCPFRQWISPPGHITRLREALGLTQAAFAAQVGVDKMTVSRWERGTIRPGKTAIKRIEAIRKRAIRRGVPFEV